MFPAAQAPSYDPGDTHTNGDRTMADEPNEPELDDETATLFETWFQKRQADEEKKKDRAKPPKDFGDALDRIADAVADKLEARVAERRKKAEEADEEPTRGEGPSGFLKMLGG